MKIGVVTIYGICFDKRDIDANYHVLDYTPTKWRCLDDQ